MNKLYDLFYKDNCYSIGIRKRVDQDGLLLEDNYTPFLVFPTSADKWYADPIILSWEGKDYLFCEIYDRKKDIGYIGVTHLDSVTPNFPEKVLDIGTHLSYPCVFSVGQEVYMIPETTTKKSIELYKAIEFPYKWEYVTQITSGKEYADSTYYSDDTKRLLLTFEQYQEDGSITKVHVYDASKIIEGELFDYPSMDFEFSNQSRGGGKLFEYAGKILRPAQVCTKEYGYALNFMEVSFENDSYCEKLLNTVYPEKIKSNLNKKIIGIHTYALTQDYEIIDVKFDDPRLRYQIRRVFRYICRKLKK